MDPPRQLFTGAGVRDDVGTDPGQRGEHGVVEASDRDGVVLTQRSQRRSVLRGELGERQRVFRGAGDLDQMLGVLVETVPDLAVDAERDGAGRVVPTRVVVNRRPRGAAPSRCPASLIYS